MANLSREASVPATPVTSPAWVGWALVACRVFVGAIFLLAGLTKIWAPGSFAAALLAYGVLPVNLVFWVSTIFPWLEVALGLALLAGIFNRFAAWSAIVLLLGFCALIAQALLRGLSLEDCGCFGGITELVPALTIVLGGKSLGWHDVVRDLIYAAIALPVALRGTTPFSVDAWQASRLEDEE